MEEDTSCDCELLVVEAIKSSPLVNTLIKGNPNNMSQLATSGPTKVFSNSQADSIFCLRSITISDTKFLM